MISFFRRKLRGSSSEEVTAPLPGRMDQAKPTSDVVITANTAIYSTNLEPSKTATLAVNLPGSSPNIMESLVNSKLLDELSHLSRQFITLFTKTLSVSSETAIVLNHIESGLSFADLTSQLSHLDSLFSDCEVSPIAGSVSDVAHAILNGIEAIADSHPLVKITWFIASAGYQLAKATNEIDKGFEALARRFLNASTEINRLKSIKTRGIPLETQCHLSECLNVYVQCLADVVQLYLAHLETPNRFASVLFGTASKNLEAINTRIDTAQKNLARVKLDGTLEIIASVASNIVDLKLVAEEALTTSKRTLAILETADLSKDLMVLRSHLGQYTEIHSTSEILALKSKRNPKTRGWIIDRMVESIRRQENTKQIVWLRGEAGTGKSVIAGCVADELETKGVLGASFFCQHDNKLRDNVSAMIQTISYELAKKNAEFRKRLLISLEDSKFRDKSHPSIQDLVTIFIINPFQDWSSTDPCAIILDALDELEDHSHVAAVLDAFQSLHHSVKLFLTSRHDVVVSVRGKKSYDIELFDVESQANKADIRVFTRDRLVEIAESFGDIQSEELDKLVETLAEASKGLFIWITLVLGNVGGSDKFTVSEEETLETMEEVLGEGAEVQETGKQMLLRLEQTALLDLHSLYCRALFKAYATDSLASDFKIAAGVILEAKVPISADCIVRFASHFSGASKISKIRVTKTLKLLQSLLKTNKDGKLAFIHRTVYDYLSNIECHSSCSEANQTCKRQDAIHCCHNTAKSKFQIDADQTSFNLAQACLEVLNSDTTADRLHQNMASLDAHIKHPSWYFEFSQALEYSVSYWHTHFVEAFSKCPPAEKKSLLASLHQFCSKKLLFYLEAILLLGKLNLVSAVVGSITTCLSPYRHHQPETSFILSILKDLKFVAFNFRLQLLTSPLQVYKHALIGVPHDTDYFRTYGNYAPARMTLGAKKAWGPYSLHDHTSNVQSVAISANSATVVSGSSDRTVKIWSAETGECVKTLLGHSSAVAAVALSLDAKIIVSGSSDSTVKIWDIESGECERTLVGHLSSITAVAVSCDGKRVASGSNDKTVKVWSVETGECLLTFVGHGSSITTVAFSASGGEFVVSGSEDASMKQWLMETGDCVRTFVGHSAYVNSVAISSDNKLLVSGSGDNSIKIWSLETDECEKTLLGHSFYVVSVAISGDNQTIASGSFDKTIKLWSTETGECIKTLVGHSDWIRTISMSPDGKTIASGSDDMSVKLWSTEMKTRSAVHANHSSIIMCLNMSVDGKTVVSGSGDKTIKVWSTASGECIQTFGNEYSGAFSVAVSSDAKMAISEQWDNTVRIWSIETGECVQHLDSNQHPFDLVVKAMCHNDIAAGPDSVRVSDGWIIDESGGKSDLIYDISSAGTSKINGSSLCWSESAEVLSMTLEPLTPQYFE